MKNNLLEIKNLSVGLNRSNGPKLIVDSINLEIPHLTISALVGGSGSGKTTTGLAILGLLPNSLHVGCGEIHFDGKDILKCSPAQLRLLRGKDIGMVFQEPLVAFNPVFTIGYQIAEVFMAHTNFTTQQRELKVLELLDLVEIKDPKRIAGAYPHQLSGGLRQRAMIAMAAALNPKLIIADEPTSNLDVTLQARIMDLFRKLKTTLNVSILLISHDLGLVNELADNVSIMHRGRIIESGETKEIWNNPKEKYTQSLLEAFRI